MTDLATDRASSPVSLVIPCRAEYVALCRLVAGALGVRDDLDEEVVSDIKVIVTEACNCFLAMARAGSVKGAASCGPLDTGEPGEASRETTAGGGADDGDGRQAPGCSIRLDFDSRPEAFVISVLYPERRPLVSWLEACDPMSEAGLGLTILRSLTDEMVELDSEAEGGTVLRLTKRLSY
jgi:hypothetical protein